MANSKYEYVRHFEQPDSLLSNTWIVVRIDGRGFSKLTAKYKFVKPNDRNALDLMNAAAVAVMKELPDLVLAYGNSDEYSFVFHKDCVLFERRASKLTTTITSTFTSYYVFLWSQYFPEKPLTPPLPSFDGRAVCYPSDVNLRDYMSWRQVDCHINNLYNTTFWALVQQGGMGAREAEQRLSGTYSSDKNEILFKEFGINYNDEPECFKKGTVLYRDFFPTSAEALPQLVPQPPQVLSNIATPRYLQTSTEHSPPVPTKDFSSGQDRKNTSPAKKNPEGTFLTSASTPSPPLSPENMFDARLPNPLRSNPVSPGNNSYPSVTMPLSPPSTVASPMGHMYSTSGSAKPFFANLTPIPLSPPTLKPSTKPPHSLNAPNPTTRTNFSPTTPPMDFPSAFPISGYRHNTSNSPSKTSSHSASQSLTLAGSSTVQAPRLKKRSPSQPHLPSYFAAGSTQHPPVIPLRISSIPMDNQPRKLSLQNCRSMSTLKATHDQDEKENMRNSAQTVGSITPRKLSPPLRTNKALPSPPINIDDNERRGNQDRRPRSTVRNSPPRRVSESYKRDGQVWPESTSAEDVRHPGIAELPASSTNWTRSHSRLHSAPVSAAIYHPNTSPDVQALSFASNANHVRKSPSPSSSPAQIEDFPVPPSATKSQSKPQRGSQVNTAARTKDATDKDAPAIQAPSKKGKVKLTEQGGWAAGTNADEGRPVQMSRTQKDKDRKKRSKAQVLIEHVDLIRDEFWEKRPWILSGKTG